MRMPSLKSVSPLLMPLALSAAVFLLAPPALAQWQWVDKNGRKVFSDSPPPADIPQNSILKRPGSAAGAAQPAATAAVAAAPPAAAASAPRLATRDAALEEKKKAAEQAEAEKKKAQQAELAKAKAENCTRARRHLATLESGVRIQQLNAKGEREFMNDEQRAAEMKRARDIVATDCAAG